MGEGNRNKLLLAHEPVTPGNVERKRANTKVQPWLRTVNPKTVAVGSGFAPNSKHDTNHAALIVKLFQITEG